MSDAIAKYLKKLSQKEREILLGIVQRILSDDWAGLDIKRLVGKKDLFRVRSGNSRIVFEKVNNEIMVIQMGKRSESTYKGI